MNNMEKLTKKDKWRKIGALAILLLCFGIIGSAGAAIAAVVHHYLGIVGVSALALLVAAGLTYMWYQTIYDDDDFTIGEED